MKNSENIEFRNRLIREVISTLLKENKFRKDFIIRCVCYEFFLKEDMILKHIIPAVNNYLIEVDQITYKRELTMRLTKVRETLYWVENREKQKPKSINNPTLF